MLQHGLVNLWTDDKLDTTPPKKENCHNLEATKIKITSMELKNKHTNKQTRLFSRCSPTLPPTHVSPSSLTLSLPLSLYLPLSPLFFFVPFYLQTVHLSLASSNPHGRRPSQIRLIVTGAKKKPERPRGCRRASPNCDQMFPLRAARERRAAPNIFRHIRVPSLSGLAWLVLAGRAS